MKYIFTSFTEYGTLYRSFLKTWKDYTENISNFMFEGKLNFENIINESGVEKLRAKLLTNLDNPIPLDTSAYIVGSEVFASLTSSKICRQMKSELLVGCLEDCIEHTIKGKLSYLLVVDFEKDDDFNLEHDLYCIEFKCNTSSISRMEKSLMNMLNFKTSDNLFLRIIDPILFKRKKFSTLVNYQLDALDKVNVVLNKKQRDIVKRAIVSNFTIIQGPPGTGKTLTCASIVYNLFNLDKERIIVCAPSNTAADNIARKLEKMGVPLVRVYSRKKEEKCALTHLSLHNLVYKEEPRIKFLNIPLKKEYFKGEDDIRALYNMKDRLELKFLKLHRVVVTTLATAGSNSISYLKYESVIIDEASQASEPETLIPLKHCKRLVLVGDHKQLGAVNVCPELENTQFRISMFERIVKAGIGPSMLDTQYRMHPALSQFPCKNFYDGLLKDGVSVIDRTVNNLFPWFYNTVPTYFMNSESREKKIHTSYQNEQEAKIVCRLIGDFNNSNVKNENIGVVTPYKAQISVIEKILSENDMNGVEVHSVDAYQGREKNYTILSCVRSNDEESLGFLKDKRRLNVAITRAKYGMIIIGNAQLLSHDSSWLRLLEHYASITSVLCSAVPSGLMIDHTCIKMIQEKSAVLLARQKKQKSTDTKFSNKSDEIDIDLAFRLNKVAICGLQFF